MAGNLLLRISEIGINKIPDVFNTFFEFVNTPVSSWLNFNFIRKSGLENIFFGNSLFGYLELLQHSVVSRLLSPISSFINGVLSAIGFDFSLPLWEFLLSNLVPISTILLLIKFGDLSMSFIGWVRTFLLV